MDGSEFDIEAYNEGEDLFNRGCEVADLIGRASATVEQAEKNLGKDGSDEQKTVWAEELAQAEREQHGLALGYINGVVKAIRATYIRMQPSPLEARSGHVTGPQGSGI